MELRNPYVILGVPFGVTRDEATSAFARRSRGLRHREDGTAQLTELTWALNQVQDAIVDPSLALHVFRVPCDPSALVPEASGAFQPAGERMERRTGPSDAAWNELLAEVRSEAQRALHDEVVNSTLPPR